MRLAIIAACVAVGGVASAESTRVRWRGVTVEGRAPAALQPAASAHVAVALKQLGSSLVTVPPARVEAAARCTFPAGARAARCVVRVSGASGSRAERRAEIRYRDADDLAESLALLVSDILSAEFPDVVGAPRSSAASPPPPTATAPQPASPTTGPANGTPPVTTAAPPSTPPAKDEAAQRAAERAHQAEMQRQLELVQELQRDADQRARSAAVDAREAAERADRERRRPRATPRPAETRTAVELAALGVFGLGPANPTLVGGASRVMWARSLLRLGGSLSLAGMRQTLSGHDLGFFRGLVAARAGVGWRSAVVDVDLSAGPALLVIVDDAHTEGRHAFASLAFAVGPRLALALSGRLALVVGADLAVALTDGKVLVGDVRLAQFSRAALEVTLGLAWRTRR